MIRQTLVHRALPPLLQLFYPTVGAELAMIWNEVISSGAPTEIKELEEPQITQLKRGVGGPVQGVLRRHADPPPG